MSTARSFVALAGLAAMLALGAACVRLFAGSSVPARDAEIAACAGLAGRARADCEARHREP